MPICLLLLFSREQTAALSATGATSQASRPQEPTSTVINQEKTEVISQPIVTQVTTTVEEAAFETPAVISAPKATAAPAAAGPSAEDIIATVSYTHLTLPTTPYV